MFQNIHNKIKKYLNLRRTLLVLSAVFVLFVFSGRFTQAFLGEAFGDAIVSLFDVIRLFIAGIVYILGRALEWAIVGPIQYADEQFVKEGARISRDLANMFLTFILIIISLATIFRYQAYGAKKLLPKLIAVALLINFSLVIAGGIINTSNLFSSVFINMATGGEFRISEQMANSLRLGDTKSIREDALESPIGGSVEEKTFKGVLMQIVFLSMAAFIFGAGFFFMLIRTMYLWFLLILSPIAFMLWILPSTQQYWNMWWNAFIKWVLFAPIFTFFLALAVLNIDSMGTSVGKFFSDGSITGMGFMAFGNSIKSIMQFIMFGFLTLGGLMVAQNVGVYGAETTMKWAKAAYKGTAKGVGRGGIGVVGGAAGFFRKSKEEGREGERMGFREGYRGGMLAPTRAAAAAAGLKERIFHGEEERKKAYEETKLKWGAGGAATEGNIDKQLKVLEKEDQENILKILSNRKTSPAKRIAAFTRAAKEGWVGGDQEKDIEELAGLIKTTGLKDTRKQLEASFKKTGNLDFANKLKRPKKAEESDQDYNNIINETVAKEIAEDLKVSDIRNLSERVLNKSMKSAASKMVSQPGGSARIADVTKGASGKVAKIIKDQAGQTEPSKIPEKITKEEAKKILFKK